MDSNFLETITFSPVTIFPPTNETLNCTFDQPYAAIQIILRLYVMSPVLIIGLIMNSVNIYIFGCRKSRRQPVNLCLMLLSISDLLLLACTIFVFTLPVVSEQVQSYALINLSTYGTFLTFALSQMCSTWSTYMTVFVSAYQCLVQCRPQFAKRHLTQPNIRKALIGVWLFAIVFNLNRFFEVERTACISNRFNVSSHHLSPSDVLKDKQYYLVYHIYLTAIVQLLIPVAVLVPVNFIIIRILNRKERMNQPILGATQLTVGLMTGSASVLNLHQSIATLVTNNTSLHTPFGDRRPSIAVSTQLRRRECTRRSPLHESRERRRAERDLSITSMLVGVVSVFLLCMTVTFINNLIEILAIYHENVRLFSGSETYTAMCEIGNLLVTFNSASTFLIYLRFNERYRQSIRKLGSWPKMLKPETDPLDNGCSDTQSHSNYALNRKTALVIRHTPSETTSDPIYV